MALEPGEQLGPYEILGPLGKGGMGDVYRARDNRLRREVALKMLHDVAANDEDSLVRFQRETHAVASLNHPSILAIHDTGMHRGAPFAVTELLQGETLAERLQSGSIAPARAADVACQIADGLSAAHAQGVIHRDIKPENIFLTNDGRAKILDFGIARIENPGLRTGAIPSMVGRGSTSSQMLVGTAGYVSPEQVRGAKADARSDLFALGAVFYEMLAGRKAFQRGSPVETLGAVLKDDPRRNPESEKSRPTSVPSSSGVSRRIRPTATRARATFCLTCGLSRRRRSASPRSASSFAACPPGSTGARERHCWRQSGSCSSPWAS